MPAITKEVLSSEFVRVLRGHLDPGQWEEMRRRNAAEAGPDVCHSHDFCDANIAMYEAFTNLGVDPFPIGDGEMLEENVALWNGAWDLAWRDYLR